MSSQDHAFRLWLSIDPGTRIAVGGPLDGELIWPHGKETVDFVNITKTNHTELWLSVYQKDAGYEYKYTGDKLDGKITHDEYLKGKKWLGELMCMEQV